MQLRDVKRALDQAAIVATTDVARPHHLRQRQVLRDSGYSRERAARTGPPHHQFRLHSKEFIRELWVTIANGGVWHGELQNRAKDGHPYWVDTTIVPFLDERGKPFQYIAIRADITARKQAEERLRAAGGAGAVGQMAAVVAHEVRNPLAGIKGAMQVLIGRRGKDDQELPVLRDIVARVDSLNDLISDLMVFARPRPPQLADVELRHLVARRHHDGPSRSVVPGRCTCRVEGEAPPRCTADAELVRGTLLNLLLNAGQAMSGRGRWWSALTRADGKVVIAVADNGPGIPEALRAQVFEPFFTTKARGGGLGLAIARRTAEIHGGDLTLECPPGGGTIVTLTLPAAQTRASERPAAALT